MTYVPPPSFYDIFPNDYLNWNLPPLAGNFAGGAPVGTPRFGLQYPGSGGPVPVPSTQTGVPAFQAPAPVDRAFSAGSSVALPSLLSQSTPSGSSAPSFIPSPQDLAQLSQTQGDSPPDSAHAPRANRRTKRSGPPRRRGPNKRRPGSGYVDMMSGLPEEVQNALRQEYADCCEVVRGKDASTVQKHRFTRRHFNKLDPQHQRLLPAFTCPAFVGLHEKCKSAKAGRYDSTERHCNNCPGFRELSENSRADTLFPFAVSKEEFDAVQRFRKTLKPGKEINAPAIVRGMLLRLVKLLNGALCLSEPEPSESHPEDVSADAAAAEEQPSPPPPPPVDPSPSAQPQQLEQPPLPAQPICNATGGGGADLQATAAWLDAFSSFNAFAQGPLLGPQFNLYPAIPGPSTLPFPNANFYPAAGNFGSLLR